jgi:hypothetical protein
MTRVKSTAVGLTRAFHLQSSNDIHCTKALPSLAEVEEHQLVESPHLLRVELRGLARVVHLCHAQAMLASSGG